MWYKILGLVLTYVVLICYCKYWHNNSQWKYKTTFKLSHAGFVYKKKKIYLYYKVYKLFINIITNTIKLKYI